MAYSVILDDKSHKTKESPYVEFSLLVVAQYDNLVSLCLRCFIVNPLPHQVPVCDIYHWMVTFVVIGIFQP